MSTPVYKERIIQEADITGKMAVITLFVTCSVFCTAAVSLQADGPGNTYELISSVLGGNPMEVPDCSHPGFGRHIIEEWDDFIGKYVFVFHIHVIPDDDRCINFDRQRNEIKTYGPSPAYLKGEYDEVHTYRWRFKLDAGFQPSPSFTHIFQIKAGDGSDSGAPTITFTPRYGSPETLQLIFTPSSGTSGGGTKAQVPLDSFKGEWVQAYVRTLYSETGTIDVLLTRVRDGAVLLSYTNDNLDMWRGDATFNRPKWGIYRSLNSPAYLRDEQVRFADFCIAEGDTVNGDIDGDGMVTLLDFNCISAQWLSAGWFVPSADIAPVCGDGLVNLNDLVLFVQQWGLME